MMEGVCGDRMVWKDIRVETWDEMGHSLVMGRGMGGDGKKVRVGRR